MEVYSIYLGVRIYGLASVWMDVCLFGDETVEEGGYVGQETTEEGR